MDWFLYNNGLRHERVKLVFSEEIKLLLLSNKTLTEDLWWTS